MAEEAAAFWVAEAGRGEIRKVSILGPGADEVTVRATFSGISRGTESLVFNGLVPVTQYEQMRCPFQDGRFPGPVKYGYASVGVVERAGSTVPKSLVTEHVFCLYPHQSRYNVPAASVARVPSDVPDRRAVLAANMETAVNALWDARPVVGDRIAVVGAGTVGCLLARLATGIPGVDVELIDINPARRSTAEALGVEFAEPGSAGGDADIVVHSSGHEEGLSLALSLAGFEAQIVEMSWFGARPVAVPLGEDFHSKRLSIAASQVGHVAPARRARRTRMGRLELALQLLADPHYDCLLTGESDLAELPTTMRRLARTPGDTLCHVVRYHS